MRLGDFIIREKTMSNVKKLRISIENHPYCGCGKLLVFPNAVWVAQKGWFVGTLCVNCWDKIIGHNPDICKESSLVAIDGRRL